MKIGFSGTRGGMTDSQRAQLEVVLADCGDGCEFHHGDCIGADEQAHVIAITGCDWVVVHPPIDQSLRAFCLGDEERQPREYLQRNHDIVDETHLLVIAPATEKEELRSGTWATYRYAKRVSKPVIVLKP